MFLRRRGAAGSSLGLPVCFAGCVGFGEMVEYCRYRYRSGNSPSGVPFLEMLEYPPLKKPL